MAGSYKHIVDNNNNFKGVDLLDHMGDAHEALEECWHIIDILSEGDRGKINEAHLEYIKRSGGNLEYAKSHPIFKL